MNAPYPPQQQYHGQQLQHQHQQQQQPFHPSQPQPQQQPPPSSSGAGQQKGTLFPGQQLSVGKVKVTVEKYLSEGGFAHVYLVKTQELINGTDRHVLKRVAVREKSLLDEVRREVEVMKLLRGHPNIVNLIDADAFKLPDGTHEVLILMEFASGGGIIDMMNRRLRERLTEEEILQVFVDVCEGVAKMHSLSPPLIHRDLKVENILQSGTNLFKLCDFGSVAVSHPPPSSMAEMREVELDINTHTTMQYRAPEMVDVYQRRVIDEKSDIWALGVLLYKLCYYTTPFEEHGPLAILNVQYRVPPFPVYSNRINLLIGSMLQEYGHQRPSAVQILTTVHSMRGTKSPFHYNEPKSSQPTNSNSQNLFDIISSVPAPVAAAPTLNVTPMRRGRPTKGAGGVEELSPGPAPLPVATVVGGAGGKAAFNLTGERVPPPQVQAQPKPFNGGPGFAPPKPSFSSDFAPRGGPSPSPSSSGGGFGSNFVPSSSKPLVTSPLPTNKAKATSTTPHDRVEDVALEQEKMAGGRPFIKIRFLTWNMHDSIPKGDLTPLLGKVPPYSHPLSEDPSVIPQLPLNDSHPYHLIVVAGQECPTPSGIPMGLGAVKWGIPNPNSNTSMPSTPLRAPPNSPFGPATGERPSQASLPLPLPPSSTAQSAPLTVTSLDIPKSSSVPVPSPSPSSATPSAPNPTTLPSTSLLPSPNLKDLPPNLTIQVSNLTASPAKLAPLSLPALPNNKLLLSPSVPPSPSTNPTTWLGVPTMKISPGSPPIPSPAVSSNGEKAAQQLGSHLGDKEREKEAKEKDKHHFHHRNPQMDSKGWTDVLTDWFANRVGEGQIPSAGLGSPGLASSTSKAEGEAGGEEGGAVKELVIEDEGAGGKEVAGTGRYKVVQEGRGTYELLVKERLLGIYLCVYVWKGCRQLVKNTSTSYVTTGLIGGRFGNKGGVACSVHLGDTRLLFVNSHLAAHASRSDVRLLNVAKIKSELDVDAFLESGDERLLMEDPTDRFDSTFWMGDLNFRLDVSRIHADWLVSRKEYAQALRFDQLKKIMDEGLGFVGFQEAEINFPPTYKYDLAKPLKRSNTRSKKKVRDPSLSGVQEASEHGAIEEADDDDGEEADDAERSSIISSGWTSLNQSTFTSDEEDVEPAPPPASLPQQGQQLAEKVIQETQKIFLPSTAIKAKKKLLGLIKMPSSPGSAPPSRSTSITKRRPSNTLSDTTRSVSGSGSLDLDRLGSGLGPSTTPPSSNGTFAAAPSPTRASVDGGSPPRPQLGRKLSARLRRSFSGKEGPSGRYAPASDDDSEDSDDTSKDGVYDTSSKKRVPSWCDRVLWKTFEEDYPEPVRPPLRPTEESPVDEGHSFTRLNRIASALHIRRRNSREVKRSTSISSQLSNNIPSPRISLVTSNSFNDTSSVATLSPAGTSSSPSQHVHWGTGSSQRNSVVDSSSAQSNLPRSINGRRRSNSANTPTTLTPPPSTTTTPTRPSPATRNSNPVPHIDHPPSSPSRTVTSPPSSHPTSPILDDPSRPAAHRYTSEPLQHPHPLIAPPVERGSWFSRLLQIHPSPSSILQTTPEPEVKAVEEELVKRRKGEVLPLLYGTLDDAEMRQIQGFSDHRPVNAVMALFI